MPLSATGNAIGAVTRLLQFQLQNSLQGNNIHVSIGRTEPPSNSFGNLINPRLNLFLYEIHFDEHMINVTLFENQPPPIWIVLRYLLTAFDDNGESDTIKAHEYLGMGIKSLQSLNFLSMKNSSDPALIDNPEDLKITFIESSYEFLSKIMQGSDEKYRLSISFEVRPIMIAFSKPLTNSFLVGIDYTKDINDKSKIIGKEGINLEVIPSIFAGPSITSIFPSKIESNPGSTFTILGENFDSDTIPFMNSIEIKIRSQKANEIECSFPSIDTTKDDSISAGSHPIWVIKNLKNGRKRSSNITTIDLLPTLDSAFIVDASKKTIKDENNKVISIYADIHLEGKLIMQNKNDDVIMALYQEDKIVRIIETLVPDNPDVWPKISIEFHMIDKDAVKPGKYNILLMVNGQQAQNRPIIEFNE